MRKGILCFVMVCSLVAKSHAFTENFKVPEANLAKPLKECKVLFSSQKNLADELVALINEENKSIKAAVYCLMHRSIANALMKAHRRGVNVEIVVDPFSVKKSSPLKSMAFAGIPLYVWHPKEEGQKKRSLMHDKFCVFGREKVWTGSFNFTFDGATRNQENAVVLYDTQIAERYLKEFERLKTKGSVSYESFAPPS